MNRPMVRWFRPVPPDNDPVRNRMRLVTHLLEYRLGNVVVAAPVCRALGVW